jgi:hypothetical protein
VALRLPGKKSIGRAGTTGDNDQVLTFEPVIETWDARGFTAWPVGAGIGPQDLVLSGALAPADIGTAMAVIAVYNHGQFTPPGEEDDHPTAARLIQRLIEADALIAPGGLRVRDTATGLTVNPGCCCGLENWQEWNQVITGQSPWLGHGPPAPWVEHLGHAIRVWPDGGDGPPSAAPTGTLPIEIPISSLPGLIATAHQQLRGFLDLLEPWALPLAGPTAASLAPVLAAHFHVSWPTHALTRPG